MSKNHYDGLEIYLVSQVRYHASRLRKHPALCEFTISDLEQELMLGFLLHRHKYNPSLAGWKTFVNLILTRVNGRLIEQAVTKKRGNMAEHVPFESLSDEPVDMMTACELHIALKQTADKLPVKLARLLRDLYVLSLKEIAREQKTAYLKLYYQLTKLRAILKRFGLNQF